MAEVDIDFEGLEQQNNNSNTDDNNQNNDDTTHLNGNDTDDITSKNNNDDSNNNNDDDDNSNSNNNDTDDNSSTGELEPGTQLEFDGVTYTVAENGDIVDEAGKVFKEAKDVKEWLNSVDVDNDDNNNSLSISSIQEALGITVTDSEGKAVEFTDDAAGVKAYVNSVIDLKSNELQEAAINKLYTDNPLLKQFVDYVQVNGTPKGFGEIPDRSTIELSKDNEAQQEAIIRMAAKEFGNKSLNDNYIKYLKDGGGLYDEAKAQLQALVEKDAAYRSDIEARAEKARKDEEIRLENYWKNVNNVINSRVIAGYKLPESFTKEVNGKKVVITPNDFYNYLYKATEEDTDGNKVSGYQRDLSKLTDEEYLNRELLDAWLMFTGGTYKDLIDMAVKEDKVRQLRIKSKQQRSTKSVKIVTKSSGKTDINDIIL